MSDIAPFRNEHVRPLVSVIIPCYNASAYVAEAIQSAIDQTYPNCEIIVIDDGSTDGSLEVIKSFEQTIRYETRINQGACAARNRGISLAKGAYVKFLDADDLLLPDAIAKQVSISEELPTHAICYGMSLDYETREPVFDKVRLSLKSTEVEALTACYKNDILISCPLHRKEILQRDEVFFDSNLRRGQEWNFHLRIAVAGGVFAYHPDPIFCYRRHDSPSRISNLKGERWCQIELQKNSLTNELIENHFGGQLPDKLKTAIYVRAYGLARYVARWGGRRQAEALFEFCESLSAKTDEEDLKEMGSPLYHFLRRVSSPYRVEKLIQPFRRLKGRKY